MTWQLALAVAAALFGAFIVWRVRPSLGPPRVSLLSRSRRDAFAAARASVLAATSPGARALALCDAGDARAALAGSATSALGYYLRAMRTDPTATEPVKRAALGLARRPRALESLLWRRLGASSWDGQTREATLAALVELERVYASSLRNRVRAKALRFALAALHAPVTTTAPVATESAKTDAAAVDKG